MALQTQHLAALPFSPSEHRTIAASHADNARPHLIEIAKHADQVGDQLTAHKTRAAILIIDEIRSRLAENEGAA